MLTIIDNYVKLYDLNQVTPKLHQIHREIPESYLDIATQIETDENDNEFMWIPLINFGLQGEYVIILDIDIIFGDLIYSDQIYVDIKAAINYNVKQVDLSGIPINLNHLRDCYNITQLYLSNNNITSVEPLAIRNRIGQTNNSLQLSRLTQLTIYK